MTRSVPKIGTGKRNHSIQTGSDPKAPLLQSIGRSVRPSFALPKVMDSLIVCPICRTLKEFLVGRQTLWRCACNRLHADSDGYSGIRWTFYSKGSWWGVACPTLVFVKGSLWTVGRDGKVSTDLVLRRETEAVVDEVLSLALADHVLES